MTTTSLATLRNRLATLERERAAVAASTGDRFAQQYLAKSAREVERLRAGIAALAGGQDEAARLRGIVADLCDVLDAAVARVDLANAEGDSILSAWLPTARAALDKARKA